MMIIIGLLIFSFSTWAVFSHRFCDGIVTKHFLTFAAITSMLTIVNPDNTRAGLTAIFSLLGGVAYWFYKHRVQVKEYWRIVLH